MVWSADCFRYIEMKVPKKILNMICSKFLQKYCNLRIYFRLKVFIYVCLYFVTVTTFANQNQCVTLFKNTDDVFNRLGAKIIDGPLSVAKAQEQSKILMKEIAHRSEMILSQARENRSEIEVDFLCVGGGAACLTAAINLPQAQRRQSLIIEQNKSIGGVYSEIDFFLNTRVEENQIPGASNQLSLIVSNGVVHSSQLALHFQTTLLESKVPALIEQKIKNINVLKDQNGTFIVHLLTESGLTIKAKQVFLGTGFGSGATKVQDSEYKNSFAFYQNQARVNTGKFQKIMHSADFLAVLKILLEAGDPQAVRALLPNVICLFGGGDGARLVLDSLARLMPESNLKIIWIGNNSKDASEFRKGQTAVENKIRKISWLYDHGLLSGVEGLVEAVSEKNGQFLVQVRNGDQVDMLKLPVDMIIDSSGYSSDFYKLFNGTESLAMEVIRGKADGLENTGLGLQLKIDSQFVPVYQIGVSAGSLLQKNEIPSHENKNPASLKNNLGRIQSFTKIIFPEKVKQPKVGEKNSPSEK